MHACRLIDLLDAAGSVVLCLRAEGKFGFSRTRASNDLSSLRMVTDLLVIGSNNQIGPELQCHIDV